MNTVYLVDDDQLILDHFIMKRGLFAECGFEICGAQTNPLTALEEIKENRPNVVLSDLKMPDLSGVGLVEAFSEEMFKPIFVMISAYTDFADVRKFFAELGGIDYLIKPVADSELADLLGRLSKRINQSPPVTVTETASRQLNEILMFLKEYPAMNHSLDSIGEQFAINTTQICNLFAKHLNTTFRSYLTTLRMTLAEQLLRTTDRSIKEIGISCGYTNYFYFTQVYDKTHGQTPTEYRRALHEQ